jgi:hypothetical protein
MELGGNIVLSGFKEVDKPTLVIVKKIVGNFVKNVSQTSAGFNSINLTLKTVHERETSKMYEFTGRLTIDNKDAHVEHTDRNILVGIDNVLKKLEKQ